MNEVVRRSALATRWLGPEHMAAWDSFAARHPLGLVYHQSAWTRAIEAAFPHIRGRVLALIDPASTAIVAGLPLFDVRSWVLGRRFVAIPYASICDPLVSSDEEWRALFDAVSREAAAAGGVPVEYRTWRQPVPPTGDVAPSEVARHHFIDLAPGADAIYGRLSRTAVRRMIAKARQAGTLVRTGESTADVHAFHELFVASRRRLGLPAIPEAFFQAIWRHLSPQHRSLLVATREGRPVAAVVSLHFGGIFILEYAGEAPDAVGSGAGQLVYWEAVRAACEAGCRIFSFGRTSLDNPTLTTYKRHWATTEEDLLTFRPAAPRVQRRQVAGSTTARRLVGLVNRRAPRFAYDALSGFCFRHWG